MNENMVRKLYKLLDEIEVTEENEEEIEEIKQLIDDEEYEDALQLLKELIDEQENGISDDDEDDDYDDEEDEDDDEDDDEDEDDEIEYKKSKSNIYPEELCDIELEYAYLGLLLNNPKLIIKYYILHSDCAFEEESCFNIYKSILFTEGSAYASEIAKQGFNFPKMTNEIRMLKEKIEEDYTPEKYEIENVYNELRKLFVLRKSYVVTPEVSIQDKMLEITKYKLYKSMSIEEVKSAIEQVSVTQKFKQAILNKDLTSFLKNADNNLTNGLELPYPILSNVFKGIRKGETMAFAMPSNSGKSRFTINLAAYTAFVHKKKVLVISNEMSEEKMRLCLITTILNNPAIQKIHGKNISKTEGELLEFKFRPDKGKKVEVDSEGFIIKQEGETQKQFVKRISENSTEFNDVIQITDWVNKELSNSIYFINITDHTNDELKKVIMNYYYKEKIEYVFYDTLKPDIANIGNSEEIKKTATILSNLAQNFNLFICSTLQLTESTTLPINIDVNDLVVSRTVKEVLDTLCLLKQIPKDNYKDYEYSKEEVDTKFFDLKKYDDPNVRYYACVVDKNRAGAKPKLLMRLNLAYNSWEELGYLKLKQLK